MQSENRLRFLLVGVCLLAAVFAFAVIASNPAIVFYGACALVVSISIAGFWAYSLMHNMTGRRLR